MNDTSYTRASTKAVRISDSTPLNVSSKQAGDIVKMVRKGAAKHPNLFNPFRKGVRFSTKPKQK